MFTYGGVKAVESQRLRCGVITGSAVAKDVGSVAVGNRCAAKFQAIADNLTDFNFGGIDVVVVVVVEVSVVVVHVLRENLDVLAQRQRLHVDGLRVLVGIGVVGTLGLQITTVLNSQRFCFNAVSFCSHCDYCVEMHFSVWCFFHSFVFLCNILALWLSHFLFLLFQCKQRMKRPW